MSLRRVGHTSILAEPHGMLREPEVKTVFDAFYFTTVQLVTVSSSLKNPVTTAGRVLNILLEIWGVLFVAATTGAFASFFLSADG